MSRMTLAHLALFSALPLAACASASQEEKIQEEFHNVEAHYGATLGVYAVDTGSGRTVEYRPDERFAYASTMKALAAGALIDEAGAEGLHREVAVTAEEIVPYSPVLENHVGENVTLMEAAKAAVVHSDNTAGNKIFEALGGPEGLQRALRDRGDAATVSCRNEPGLNEAVADQECDTTTPRAVTENLRAYLVDGVLNEDERDLLQGWMEESATGMNLIRAGLPEGWKAGDKSGMGLRFGARGDTAIIFPPNGAPIVMTVYARKDDVDSHTEDAAIADSAAVAVSALRGE